MACFLGHGRSILRQIHVTKIKAFIEKAYLTSLAECGQNVVPLVSVGKKDGAETKTTGLEWG